MQEFLAPVLDFLKTHEAWAAPLGFVLAFLKSLAFVSLIVPGSALLLGIGAVVGASGIGLLPVWLAISVGAAFGDWVSYWLGFRFKDSIRDSRWAKSRPHLLERGEGFFLRWGALSIVGCRFFGPLRATVPLVAGIFEMPWLKFQTANWASAFLWAGALLSPGTLLTR